MKSSTKGRIPTCGDNEMLILQVADIPHLLPFDKSKAFQISIQYNLSHHVYMVSTPIA